MRRIGEVIRTKKAVSFGFYFFSFGAVAFLMPNLVLYYQELGFNGIQIGIIVGIAPLITMVCAPLWTGLADREKRHMLIMSVAILATVIITTIFPLIKSFAPALVLIGLFSIFNAPIPAFADSATMAMLADEKELYGRMRLRWNHRFWSGRNPGESHPAILRPELGILGLCHPDVFRTDRQPEVHIY